ncbi:MAG: hypothetical protein WB660_21840 [Candidatus Sulfotelmatobacter sp.]
MRWINNLPNSNVTTLDKQVGRAIANQKLVAQLSTFFGLLASMLAYPSCRPVIG